MWYVRTGTTEEAAAGELERKEYNSPEVVILSQESYENGRYPKCFDPKSFKRETLSEKLEKANKGSRFCIMRTRMEPRGDRVAFVNST